MSRYKEFTDKVYSCLSTAAGLGFYGYEPADPDLLRNLQVAAFLALAKLKTELDEIKASGVDLDHFEGHHAGPLNYHAGAIAIAESACRCVRDAALGLPPPGNGLPSIASFDPSERTMRVAENWSAVVEAIESLPKLDLGEVLRNLNYERVKAEGLDNAEVVKGQSKAAAVPESTASIPVVPPAADRPEATSEATAAAAGKGVAPRNLWFLQQWEAQRTDTYHRPKKVYDKWQEMKAEERAAICPGAPGKVSHDAVVQGIKRAREAHDGKPDRRTTKRKRTSRKA